MDSTAQVRLKMWESAWDGDRPSEVIPGASPFHEGGLVTSLRPVPVDIAGPFCDNVEFTLEVSDSGVAQAKWSGCVVATLILEE